eukprot:COSAG01_NODE_956_length_12480_cov_109.564090_11_plen_34_part_00
MTAPRLAMPVFFTFAIVSGDLLTLVLQDGEETT